MNIIFVTCGLRIEHESDIRSSENKASENKAWTKIQACTRFEPMTSTILVQCSTNWADKPTGSWKLCWFVIRP